MGLFLFLNVAEAKVQITCTDSDGGLNWGQEGEVTITASRENKVFLQRSFRDGDWLSQKKYVEFYCDASKPFPLYKIISCADGGAAKLPVSACPSTHKDPIKLEARHASQQPRSIVASEKAFVPYYTVSLSAPVEAVKVKALRFKVEFGGLEKTQNTRVKITKENQTNALGHVLLGWESSFNPTATVILRFDQPLTVNVGRSTNLTFWMEGLVEKSPYIQTDNQASAVIESLELEKKSRMYFESKPQVNAYQPN